MLEIIFALIIAYFVCNYVVLPLLIVLGAIISTLLKGITDKK